MHCRCRYIPRDCSNITQSNLLAPAGHGAPALPSYRALPLLTTLPCTLFDPCRAWYSPCSSPARPPNASSSRQADPIDAMPNLAQIALVKALMHACVRARLDWICSVQLPWAPYPLCRAWCAACEPTPAARLAVAARSPAAAGGPHSDPGILHAGHHEAHLPRGRAGEHQVSCALSGWRIWWHLPLACIRPSCIILWCQRERVSARLCCAGAPRTKAWSRAPCT